MGREEWLFTELLGRLSRPLIRYFSFPLNIGTLLNIPFFFFSKSIVEYSSIIERQQIPHTFSRIEEKRK